ncbi:MAG: glucose 1-dehydrogenase [Acidobacteriota bacterium]|jgi:3-oxoacyl-[acyl-carrier protein] reductase|nr:glucose 1-dehydrogenase [Acidobacteriota bacterium]
MGEFDGRVVVVTGGGLGLGEAFSRGFAEAGAKVVVADIADQAAETVAKEIDGLAVHTDVADESSTKAMAKAAHDAFGRIDVLINNASLWTAILPMKPWDQIPVEEWDKVMAVNVKGYFLAARAVVPYMKENGWGRIVNLSSNTSLSGVPGILHYVTSKGAAIGFTRALAREIGTEGITVNAITPGLTSTEGVKAHYSEEMLESRITARSIHRQQQPGDLVGAVMFLASAQADFITGQTLNIDGGQLMH